MVPALALLALGGACSTDHDALAKKDPGSSGGAAGSPADGGGGEGASGASPGDASGATDGALVEGSLPDAGPNGPDVLTLMHGIADAEDVVFCFARLDQGMLGEPIGAPLPSGGLAYGGALVVDSLPGVDFAVDSFQAIVIAGDLSLIAGLDCVQALDVVSQVGTVDAGTDSGSAEAGAGDSGPEDADIEASIDGGGTGTDGSVGTDASIDGAGIDASADGASDALSEADADLDAAPDTGPPPPDPPALRAATLPVIPAGTFTGGRSFLMVAAGCIGGPAFTHAAETSICGATYKPLQPTLQPVLVVMSRQTVSNRLGLQVVNASVAANWIEVRNVPQVTGGEAQIAAKVVFGAIGPTPPKLDLSEATYGVGDSEIAVRISGSSVASMSVPWQEVFAQSPVKNVIDGDTITLVLIGPRPGVSGFEWWNEPTFIAIRNDAMP